MPTPAQHRAQAEGLDFNGVVALWDLVRAGADTPAWDAGAAFEYLVVRAFQLEGALVTWPYTVEVQGELAEQTDGAIRHQGVHCLLEVKDRQNPLNVEPLAKMRNQLLRRPSLAIGSVFSRSGFTDPARVLASFFAPQAVLLWDGAEFDSALRQHSLCNGLHLKLQMAIEHNMPDFSLLAEGIEP